MCKLKVLLAAAIFSTGFLQAEFNHPIFSAQLAGGFRYDNFEFAIQRPQPNGIKADVLEDPIFRQYFNGMKMIEVSSQISYASCNNYYIRVTGDYGHVIQGDTRTSTYLLLRRPSIETTEIKGNANSGHVADASAALGYQFTSNGRRCLITPLAGYAYHQQSFRMGSGKQVINRIDRPQLLGNVPNLSFKYSPYWYGPWIGADVLVSVDVPCVLAFGSLEYHYDQFRSHGNWNFSDIFSTTFTQKGRGHGLWIYAGFDYRVACHWYVGVVGYWRNFQANKGKHRTSTINNELSDLNLGFGTIPVIPKEEHSRIRSVHWNSWSVALSIDYRLFD